MSGPVSRRAALGAIGAAPAVLAFMPASAAAHGGALSPAMAAAVATHRTCLDAYRAESDAGSYRATLNRHNAAFGLANVDALSKADRARFDASFAEVIAAEEDIYQRFTVPRWAAAEAVFAIPAASIADVMAKVDVAEAEEAFGEVVDALVADLRRIFQARS